MSLRAVIGVLLIGAPANARAAPAPACPTPEDVEVACQATPTFEEARLITGREFYARANELYDEKDYLGAAAAWEQVILLMPDKEADLHVQLAHAYHFAYQDDRNEDHLRKARDLFSTLLDSLASDDVSRADIESELSKVEAELEALASAEAEAQAQRDEAIRQEQISLTKAALVKAEAKRRNKLQKTYLGVGGGITGSGVGSLAAMTTFLVRGARLEGEGQATSQTMGVPDGYYRDLLNRGGSENRAAWVTGIVGGVLTAAGGSLLIVAAIQQKRVIGRRRSKVAIVPTLGGALLRF